MHQFGVVIPRHWRPVMGSGTDHGHVDSLRFAGIDAARPANSSVADGAGRNARLPTRKTRLATRRSAWANPAGHSHWRERPGEVPELRVPQILVREKVSIVGGGTYHYLHLARWAGGGPR